MSAYPLLGRTVYDDAQLDALPLKRGPAWMRRLISVPRCTNSLSLYMFMLLVRNSSFHMDIQGG